MDDLNSKIKRNEEKIKISQERIEKISLEGLAENLYNASLGHFMWRPKEEVPFYIDHRGTHADYEIILPNVHEVYNVSSEEIKKKMIDSATLLIDSYPGKIKAEKDQFEKINISSIFYLLKSFSGNESYPLELHDVYHGKPYLVKEDSKEMRNYIKENFRRSLIDKMDSSSEFGNIAWKIISPIELLPIDYWKEQIGKGFGGKIFISRNHYEESFFGEEKILIDINEMVSYGFRPEHLDSYSKKYEFPVFGPEDCKEYKAVFEGVKDFKLKKEFMDLMDKKESYYWKYHGPK